MQVRKFEAPTMKEALEMVKNQLGPDAIILNAKDNSKGFGLLGKQSIEITAAISEKQLQKKQWAESRLKEEELLRLKRQPAKLQKQFIEKSVKRYVQSQPQLQQEAQVTDSTAVASVTQSVRRPLTQMRYIDIDTSSEPANVQTLKSAKGKTVNDVLREIGQNKSFVEGDSSEQRVKSAVKNALQAFDFEESTTKAMQKANTSNTNRGESSISEVQVLKNEIEELKNILKNLSHQNTKPIFENMQVPELAHVQQKLINNGLDKNIVEGLLEDARRELDQSMIRKTSFVEGFIAKKMLSEIRIKEASQASKIQAFMGPSGSGKSSHLVKLASHYVIHQNKKVGILTLDSEKVGAVEQLRIYAQILNVPFGIIKRPGDWQSVSEAARNLDYILIDFPGNALKELAEIERFRRMLPPDTIPMDKHLVISATFKDSDALEIADRYRTARPTDLIINKLDEATTHGLLYNLQSKLDMPLYSFGIGQNLPEDFEFATRERVLDLIFKITKFKNQK